jgi:hypothetical protein
MVIRLTADIEGALSREAQRQGVTPEQLALDSLGRLFGAPESLEAAKEQERLYDFLAGHVGVIDGASEAFSEDCGRRFTDQLVAG